MEFKNPLVECNQNVITNLPTTLFGGPGGRGLTKAPSSMMDGFREKREETLTKEDGFTTYIDHEGWAFQPYVGTP